MSLAELLLRASGHGVLTVLCAWAVFRHRPVMPVNFSAPTVEAGGYVAPSASVSGDVTVSAGASVWYGAVVRGTTPCSRPPCC